MASFIIDVKIIKRGVFEIITKQAKSISGIKNGCMQFLYTPHIEPLLKEEIKHFDIGENIINNPNGIKWEDLKTMQL